MSFQDAWRASNDSDRETFAQEEVEDWTWEDIISEEGTADGGGVFEAYPTVQEVRKQNDEMNVMISVDYEEHVYQGCPDMPRVNQCQTNFVATVYDDGKNYSLDISYTEPPQGQGNDFY